jgi:phosphoglycerate kinase
MDKMTIDDLRLSGKRVLVRVDFNVPLTDGQVANDKRIVASLPTINKIIESGGAAILMSHLGRPKGKVVPEMSLNPVAGRLSELIEKPVQFADDCIGEDAYKMSADLKSGEILLLENLRYYKEETDNDDPFAEKLSKHGEIYVNDAFGTAHRAHASTAGVTRYFSHCGAGYLMVKEIEYLGNALANPVKPFAAILGGAKISGKIDVINSLMDKVDKILIGGGMAFTFYKAQSLEIGKSLLEVDKIDLAKEILSKAESKGLKLVLPTDVNCAAEFKDGIDSEIYDADKIPADMMGLDVGPKTIEMFKNELSDCMTVVWNGPMGVFEFEKFAVGTIEVAKLLADLTSSGAVTIIGGGDSASAVVKAGVADKLSHISTGGGASLEFLEGKTLPGLAALTDK